MTGILVPLVLLANGLAAGVLLATQLGGWPFLRVLPDADYVRAHAFFSTRYDPWMPLCLIVTFLGDLTLAVTADGTVAQSLFATSALLALATGVISLTKNVPGNRYVQTLEPAQLPADFTERDPRPVWGPWNRRRSLLGMLAFLVNCLALVAVLSTPL
ncbi:anthrone oxygenase family protein [Amycolatopsis nigrescens]|uniref:anthrone oxygenase family protein n=1 Tax=Amycolatopsis nigrescens TaxID=381445 RepID=UPI000361D404|nr:DUF1772 domain-containing protein [Amycolatopsis nigrescens]